MSNCSCITTLPLRFVRGDSFILYGSYLANGIPINLTGGRIYMIAKTAIDVPDSAAIFNISTITGDIVITDAGNGQFCVTVPSSATLAMPQTDNPMVYNIVFEVGSGSGFPGYSGSLGYSGFSGLSGLGVYRATLYQGTITLVDNILES